MEYRRAKTEDIDELVKNRIDMRVEREEKQCPISLVDFGQRTRDYFMKHISDERFIAWLAIEDGKIVATSGMCIYCVPPTYDNIPGQVAYLVNMYTVKEYRNQGIGSKLLEYLVEEARNRGCIRLTLNTSSAGRSIYENYGFYDLPGEMEYYLD